MAEQEKLMKAKVQGLKEYCTYRANEMEKRGGHSAARTYEEIADRLKEIITDYEKIS